MKIFKNIVVGFFILIVLLAVGGLFCVNRYLKSFPKISVAAEKTGVAEAEVFSWIEQIVAFGTRKPASEGDEKTRAFIESKFLEFGLQPADAEPIAVETAQISHWGLWLKDQETGEDIPVPAYPMPFSAPTPDGPVEALIEYVGDGSGDDILIQPGGPVEALTESEGDETGLDHVRVTGRIVVFEQQVEMHNWNLYKRLFFFYDPARGIPRGYETANLLDKTARAIHDSIAPRGAIALVGLLSELPWESATYCPQLNRGVRMEIPGLWVSRQNSATIRSLLNKRQQKSASASGTKLRQGAKILVSGERGRSETFNIWAVLPGQVDEYYLVMAHHDAPFNNAVQDASGTAVMLALAKHFSMIREETPLRRGIIFLAVGAHTLGRLGEAAFAHNHRDGLLPKIALVVSVEHIAKEFSPQADLSFSVSDEPAVRMFFTAGSRKLSGIVQSSIRENDYRRSVIIPQWLVKANTGKARGISGELYEAGLPVVGLLSNSPYMFFQEDTPAAVASDQLVPTANTIISIIRAADTLPSSALRH